MRHIKFSLFSLSFLILSMILFFNSGRIYTLMPNNGIIPSMGFNLLSPPPSSPYFSNSNYYGFFLPFSYFNAMIDISDMLLLIAYYEFLLIPLAAVMVSTALFLIIKERRSGIISLGWNESEFYGRLFFAVTLALATVGGVLTTEYSLGMSKNIVSQAFDVTIVLALILMLMVPLLAGLHMRGFNIVRPNLSYSMWTVLITLSGLLFLSFIAASINPIHASSISQMFLLPWFIFQYPGLIGYPAFFSVLVMNSIFLYFLVILLVIWSAGYVVKKVPHIGDNRSFVAIKRPLGKIPRRLRKILAAVIIVVLIAYIPSLMHVSNYNSLSSVRGEAIIIGLTTEAGIVTLPWTVPYGANGFYVIPVNVSVNSTLIGAWHSTVPLAFNISVLSWGPGPIYQISTDYVIDKELTPGTYSIIFGNPTPYVAALFIDEPLELIPDN